MKTFDKIFFGIIFGAIIPITLFLAGRWITFVFLPVNKTLVFALSGLVLGLIIDLFYVRRVLSNLYEIPVSNLVLVYIFYSAGCFGIFTTMPVLNLLLGIPAGYYAAVKCIYMRREIFSSEDFFGHAAIFTSVTILLFSLISILIALTDPYNTAKKIKHMLGLNFEITVTALTLGVIGFGLLLIVIQFFVTKYSAKIFYSRLTESE